MRVLVTGGSGIVGSYVRRALSPAHHLTCLSRSKPAEQWHSWQRGDIMDADALSSACRSQDAIIHLAAIPGPGRASATELLTINVIGTVNVLETAVSCGVGRVVFASSGAATGFSFQSHDIVPDYLPIDEAHPDAPQDEYGLSKLLAESACRSYSDRHGLCTICLRINHNWCVDREGAEVAERCGWASRAGITREHLWDDRYRRAIQEPDDIWPTPGPPPPRKMLWAVTDMRDTAAAFGLSLTVRDLQHEIFLITGSDTCSLVPTPELLAQHYPAVELRAPLSGFDSLISSAKAVDLLGYRPRTGWRRSDFADWLQTRPVITPK